MSTAGVPGPPGIGLAELLACRAERSPDDPFLAGARDGRRVTYGTLGEVALRWRGALEDLGAPLGCTVALAAADPVDFALAFLGLLAAGRTVVPLDPSATAAEIAGTCEQVVPCIVVADRPAPLTLGACPLDWIAMPEGWCARVAAPGVVWPGGPAARVDDAAPAGGVALTTSGTTGRPKVVRLDEGRLLHTAAAVVAAHELSAADRCFSPLPLFHINAEVVGVLATLLAGSSVVLDDRFHRTGFWQLLARHEVTWINGVPAVLARLAPLREGETVPSGIRFARSASAPLPVPVLERFESATGIPVVEAYGMTEAASQITANPLRGRRKPGSVGVPVATEVRVVGGGPGAGHVHIRGPGVIAAYASPGHEDRVDPDGWLETGDLGYFDEDGYLYLVGRADDVINRGGEKVHPKEIEDVVLAEPGVAAAAVVAWAHQSLGQVPVAYLVPERSGKPGLEEIEHLVDRVRERCARTLSRAKHPVAYHVVERFPSGATGKVRRRSVPACTPVYSLLVR